MRNPKIPRLYAHIEAEVRAQNPELNGAQVEEAAAQEYARRYNMVLPDDNPFEPSFTDELDAFFASKGIIVK